MDSRKMSKPVGFVPKNYSFLKEATGGIILNFVEGLFISSAISFIFYQIPFVRNLKIALCVITFILIIVFEFKGCHDYTLLIALYHYIKWKKSAKKYVLGTASQTSEPVNKLSLTDMSKSVIEKAKTTVKKGKIADYESVIKNIIKKDTDAD